MRLCLRLGQLYSGASFAFTFLSWFIHDFLQHSPVYIQVGIVLLTAIFWFFLPLLRKYSSLVILVYFYSYVVYWHLFKMTLFQFKYAKEGFKICLFASFGVLAIFSILGDIPLRLVHNYNRFGCILIEIMCRRRGEYCM